MVNRHFGRNRLHQLLEFSFGVFNDGKDGQLPKYRAKNPQNERPRVSKLLSKKTAPSTASMQSASAELRSRPPCSSSPLAEDQMLPQAKLPGVVGQGAAVDQFGAGFGEWPFIKIGKPLVEFLGQDQLKNRIAEEFRR